MHGDEHDEEQHHREVDATRPLRGERAVQARGILRPDPRQPHARDDREGGGDERDREVRQLLQAVVVDPAVLGRPVERGVLQRRRHRVREHVPRRRHDPHPLARGEQQHDVDHAVGDPEHVDRLVEPQRQADAAPLVAPRRPEGIRSLLTTELQPRADDEQQEQAVEEMLPAEPRRDADGRRRGQLGRPGVDVEEALDGPERHEHPCDQHDEDRQHERREAQQQHGADPLRGSQRAEDARRPALRGAGCGRHQLLRAGARTDLPTIPKPAVLRPRAPRAWSTTRRMIGPVR